MAAIGVHLGCTSACVAVYKVRDSGSWVAGAASFGYEAKSFGLRGCERRVAGLGTSYEEAILQEVLGLRAGRTRPLPPRPSGKAAADPAHPGRRRTRRHPVFRRPPSPGADPGTFWAPEAPGRGRTRERPGRWRPRGFGGRTQGHAGSWSPPRGWGRTRPRPGLWKPRGGRRTWGPHGRRRPGGGPERLVPGGFWTFAEKEQGGRDLELDPRSVGSQLMDGRADVVANDAGDRVTPAIVAYSKHEEVVGLAAKQSRIRNISNTVMKVKQILGRSSDDPQSQKYITESKCLVIEKNGKLRYEIDTGEEKKFVSPEDVARLIFSKMKETAHSVLGSDANDVVITVPFDFGEKQKSALGEAARAAGFNVLRLIHEPSAALLAYGIGQDSPTGKSNILVFKLGGTSLSISVMEVNSGLYRVLSTNTDNNIGGTHFTETLAQYLASEFQRSFRHDVRGNARAMMKLMNGADTAKHSLSTLGSTNCFLDSLYEGQDFDCNVSRARFELLCSPLFNKCIEAIREVLEQSGFTADDINKVVLCGGSSRIPRLQQMIRDLFPAVELLNSIPPDEVIPIGAAIEAGILIGKESLSVEDALQIECSAKDILVKGVDESGANSFKVLFPSGTPLPARRQHTLQAPGSISSVCLELYESEGKNSAKVENKFAQVVLQDLDKKESGLRDILAVLTMKRDGSLHVTCTDQETGKCEAITIEVAS
ncbi:heat shock 70 kDa protein 14 isoform X9 [Ovis aries]|uniref:Heat shock protein family A (Hsp70) member 14 n=1 Tax=Ovis aries TaxID=9940 RepID=A0AC11AYA8_SHEEP|nr:heat shock 70 kDa protein 14 isoform X9 [Ovis aries]